MGSLRAYLTSLGRAGAVANARTALEQRASDERAVAGLEGRLTTTHARPASERLAA